MKKIYSYLGIMVLVCVSFIYTQKIAVFFREKDPIMINIKENIEKFNVMSVNASVNNNEIIPGLTGKTVNIEESYLRMKQVGKYDEKLLVFNETLPTVTLEKNYDKYIISGNNDKKVVSLVFVVLDENYAKETKNILKNKEISATFFVDGILAEENISLIEELSKNGNQVESIGYNKQYSKDKMNWNRNMIEAVTRQIPKYCYTKYVNDEVLDLCSKYKMYTIKPTILTGNYPFTNIKNKLKNGSIIHFDLNSTTIKELNVIISYIKQKGYKLETINNLLNETKEEK